MTKGNRLPPAKDWRSRPLDTWNVTTFTEYLRDKHRAMFGIDYVPFGGTWGMEQGVLGDLIGTQSRKNPKPRTADNEDVKRFIDETFAAYKPSARFPGTSFGFLWTYRRSDWQRIQAERLEKEARAKAEAEAPSFEELYDWL